MTDEKKILLNKIDHLLTKRTSELLDGLPDVHEVDDGIIIRFFTDWDNCDDDDTIKHKIVKNLDNPDESMVFFYIPKDAVFDLKQRFYIGCMTCLNGRIVIEANDKIRILENTTKICIDSAEVKGRALENTYLITCSDKSKWSDETIKHTEKFREVSPLS